MLQQRLLAQHAAKTTENFVRLMNEKAVLLGACNTHLPIPGLPDDATTFHRL